MTETSKNCVTCGIRKPLEQFHLHKSHRDGRASSCKECAKTRSAKWIRDNRDRYEDRRRADRLVDPEKHRAWARQSMRNRRARLAQQKVDLFAGDPCVYCGAPSTTDDHILPTAEGGSDHASNLARACLPCNQEKSGQDLLGFMLDRLQSA